MRRSPAHLPSVADVARSFALVVGFGLASLVAAAGAAHSASLRVQGFSQATNDPDGQDVVDEAGAVGPVSTGASSAGASTLGAGNASGQVGASAEFGVLRARATGSASGPFGESGGAVSGGSIGASWEDRFTILPADPSLQFQPGTFVFRLLLDGTLAASAGGATLSNTRAQFGLFVAAGSCAVGCEFRRFGQRGDFGSQGGGVIESGDPIADFTSTPVPFAFGIPVDLRVVLDAFAQAVAGLDPALSSADAALGQTLVWDGLLQVDDARGSPVTAYTVTSDSGVDWSRPVPEPATAACVALGCALLAASARRRRAHGVARESA